MFTTLKLCLQENKPLKFMWIQYVDTEKYQLNFDQDDLLQTNGTDAAAWNLCSYSDFAIFRFDKFIKQRENKTFRLFLYYIVHEFLSSQEVDS